MFRPAYKCYAVVRVEFYGGDNNILGVFETEEDADKYRHELEQMHDEVFDTQECVYVPKAQEGV